MELRIDSRAEGFRVRWHHAGTQGRALLKTDVELKAFLASFNFATAQSGTEIAQSFAEPQGEPFQGAELKPGEGNPVSPNGEDAAGGLTATETRAALAAGADDALQTLARLEEAKSLQDGDAQTAAEHSSKARSKKGK